MHMSKADVYQWFQDIQGWNRIDFICNLIHMCNSFELRFLGACIEDMAQTDYNTLKEQDIKANNLASLEHFISRRPSVDEFRSHISVCIALLQSRNYKVAAKLGDLLEERLEGLNLQHLIEARLQPELEQWMLMLTLASYHPAFTFQRQSHFKHKLAHYEQIYGHRRKICLGHRLSPKQSSTAKCDGFENPDWRQDSNSLPFARYAAYPQQCYMDYYHQPRFPGNVNNGYTMSHGMRPMAFPPNLIQPPVIGNLNHAEKGRYQNYMPNPSVSRPRPGHQMQENVEVQTRDNFSPSPVTIWSDPAFKNRAHAGNFVHCGNKDDQSGSASPPSAVSQPQTVTNITSVVSTVVTAAVTTRVSSCETNQFNSASQKPPPNDSHTEIKSAFVAVPSHDDSKAPLIKGGEVARSPKVRNRSQSGDTSSDRQGSAPARATLQFAPQPLRSSTSAPVLATVAAKSTKVSERTAGSTGGRTGPRPADVFVSHAKSGPNYMLKVNWTDGTSSECSHTTNDIVRFYKTVRTKLGKNCSNIDTIAKSGANQLLEKSQRLEYILRNFIKLSVNESNSDDFLSFFKHNAPPPISQPHRKKRSNKQVSKPARAIEGGSSSSSNSSPPLLNFSKSKILHPAVSGLSAAITPPPFVKSVSAASSAGSGLTMTITTKSAGTDDKNDTNPKPGDVEGGRFVAMHPKLPTSDRKETSSKTLNAELSIELGTLSISKAENTSSSDSPSESGKVADAAPCSTDDKSDSSQSGPLSFPGPGDVEAAASDSCFSFEFEPGDSESPPNNRAVIQNAASVESLRHKTEYPQPTRALSLGDMTREGPAYQPALYYGPSPVIDARYCVSDDPQNHGWHPFISASYLTPSDAYATLPGNVMPRTISSPVCLGVVTKPARTVYSVPDHSYDCDVGVGPHQKLMSPAAGSEAGSGLSQPSTNVDADNRSSPTSSDPDAKILDEPVSAGQFGGKCPAEVHSGPFLYAFHPGKYAAPPQFTAHPFAGYYRPPILQTYDGVVDAKAPFYPPTHPPVVNGYRESGGSRFSDASRGYRRRDHFYGDGPKSGVVSCCNCGAKGHDAVGCREPNAVDMLGANFQLKLSESSSSSVSK